MDEYNVEWQYSCYRTPLHCMHMYTLLSTSIMSTVQQSSYWSLHLELHIVGQIHGPTCTCFKDGVHVMFKHHCRWNNTCTWCAKKNTAQTMYVLSSIQQVYENLINYANTCVYTCWCTQLWCYQRNFLIICTKSCCLHVCLPYQHVPQT